jgi:hypothetical protein
MMSPIQCPTPEEQPTQSQCKSKLQSVDGAIDGDGERNGNPCGKGGKDITLTNNKYTGYPTHSPHAKSLSNSMPKGHITSPPP